MKFSLNLAQFYSNVDLKKIPREELLTRIGAQLGAVEDVTDWTPKFEGAVIVKVVQCEKHPDADKLSVCQIDDGSNETIQVVCGAPNVRAGLFAVWLKPGVTVPNSRDKDPFVLEAREIRGVVSNGMLASANELGISDDHDGILEINPEEVGREPKPGEPLTNYFGLDDFVIDCENKMFTHRPDCFGNLGVAREIAGISGLSFKSPDWYVTKPNFAEKNEVTIAVKNDVKELVPRFMAVVMNNVQIKPSPVWLQAFLSRVGIKPINNVVDVTNFVMHLTGQPLHAFDYDKLLAHANSPSLMPRLSKKGEKLLLLGQKEIELTGEEIVIATDKQAVALGGIMGGAETEVDNTTKTIVIEAANFDMFSIRRSSMRHGLFTEAVTRFTKGQSPLQNDKVLAFAMEQMTENAGATQASPVYDAGTPSATKEPIDVDAAFINERLGSNLSNEEIAKILTNVEFEVTVNEKINITPPFWRMDVEAPEDIVEEVGRLYGFDKLPVVLPLRFAKPTPLNPLTDFKQSLREKLVKFGANEILSYSFVHGDLLQKTGTDPQKWAYHIRNAISPDLQYYRTSLIPSLLAKIHANSKSQAGASNNIFALFEIGKAHLRGDTDEENLPTQHERIAFVIAADDKTVKSTTKGTSYFMVKRYVDVLTAGEATYVTLSNEDHPITAPFQKNRSALVEINGEPVGVVGEFTPSVRAALKLPPYCAGFELDIAILQQFMTPSAYEPLPAFPLTHQDLTLEIDKAVSYDKVKEAIGATLGSLDPVLQVNFEPLNIYSPGGGTNRLTFRLTMTHRQKTLTTEETNSIVDTVAVAAQKACNAVRI